MGQHVICKSKEFQIQKLYTWLQMLPKGGHDQMYGGISHTKKRRRREEGSSQISMSKVKEQKRSSAANRASRWTVQQTEPQSSCCFYPTALLIWESWKCLKTIIISSELKRINTGTHPRLHSVLDQIKEISPLT